jgi:hypothetical protein
LVLGASLAGIIGGAIVAAGAPRVLAGDALRRAIEGASVGAHPFLQGFGCNGEWWLTGPIAGLWAKYTVQGEELCIDADAEGFGGCRHVVRAGDTFWLEVIADGAVVSRAALRNANTGLCTAGPAAPEAG